MMTTHAEDDEASVNSDVAVAKPRRGRHQLYIAPVVEPEDVEAPSKPDPPALSPVKSEPPPDQLHEAEEEDDATEGLEEGLDDASDTAVAKPRRGRRPSFLGGTSATAAAALAEETVEDLEKAQESVPRRAPKTQPPRRKNTFEKVSSHTSRTATSRATSFDALNESQSFHGGDELPNYDRTINEENDTLNVLSGNSLYTLHSQRSPTENRGEKDEGDYSLATTLPTVAISRSWCITKYKWTVLLVAALGGFAVGLLVPYLSRSKTPQAVTEGTVPPVDPTSDTGTGPTIGFQDDDQVKPPPVHTTDDLPDRPTPNPTPAPHADVAAETETIDVWNSFGNMIASLPSATIERLSQSSFELSRVHLEAAAKRFVQATIHANVRKPRLALQVQEESSLLETEYVVPFVDTPLTAFDGEVPYPAARAVSDRSKRPQGGDVGRWEKYLEKIGVKEADSIQWDQENDILYVAHAQHIDVVDTKVGSVRLTIRLPDVADQTQDPWLIPGESDAWKPAPPEPFVEQLLLSSKKTHLIVFVSNYSNVHHARVKPLLKESLVTRVYTYQLRHQDAVTQYELLEPHTIHGRILHAAEAISGQHIHFVTSSRINTERLLKDPVERLYYPNWHDANYIAEVVRAAQDKYIPLFVRRLQNEIEGNDINLIPLTHWITNDKEDLSEDERQLEYIVSAHQQVEELIVVTSLSIVDTNDPSATARQGGDALTATSTSVFSTAFLGPSNVEVLGSTDTHVTLIVPGYQWSSGDVGKKVLQEATHFLQWELGTVTMGGSHKAATRFQAVGTVPGRLVQGPRESTHYYEDTLRVATILKSQWQIGLSEENRRPIAQEERMQKSFLHVLDKKTLEAKASPPLQLFQEEPLLLSSVTFFDDMAYAFPRNPSGDQASIEIIHLNSDPSSLAQQSLKSIVPVPQGFSPFLFKLSGEDNDGYLVSIGQNTSDLGLASGWMISVWDTTKLSGVESKPRLQYSLEAENTITTWEPRTFRVSPHGQVVLPMTVENIGASRAGTGNMKGFVVIDVGVSEIQEKERIRHSNVMSARECLSGSFSCGLESKSSWKVENAGGDYKAVLTVEGTKVKLTALSVGESTETWSLSLP